MSKVVKSVGRAVSKVVKGTVKAVKKFAKSKIGRVIITAAAIYFGGAALAGGFGSSAAGGSFLSGMGTGVANAASSLSTAWTSALSGNFAQAGSAISSGFSGQVAGTAANAATSAAMGGAQGLSGAAGTGVTEAAVGSTMGGASGLTMPAAATGTTGSQLAALNMGANAAGAGAGAGTGLIGSLSPMGQYAAIAGGTQLLGGTLQGYGAQKAQEDQRDYEQELLDAQNQRYADNVNEFGNKARADAAAIARQNPAPFAPPLSAPAFADRYRQTVPPMGFGNGPAQVGMINRAAASNPMTNNNFPVYNPAYYRG
jgi:hypothetical protein